MAGGSLATRAGVCGIVDTVGAAGVLSVVNWGVLGLCVLVAAIPLPWPVVFVLNSANL